MGSKSMGRLLPNNIREPFNLLIFDSLLYSLHFLGNYSLHAFRMLFRITCGQHFHKRCRTRKW